MIHSVLEMCTLTCFVLAVEVGDILHEIIKPILPAGMCLDY